MRVFSFLLRLIPAFFPSLLSGQVLVAQYPFSGNAEDATGNGLNGAVTGAVLTQDRTGAENAAYAFDSLNSFVQIPDNPLLKPEAITLSVWVYVEKAYPIPKYSGNNKNTSRQYIVFKASRESREGYALYFDQTTRQFSATIVSADGWEVTVSAPPVLFKAWNHVVMTADANDVRIYTNGVFRNLANADFPLSYKNGAPLMIGRTGNIGWDGNLFGKIDDICLFNRVARPDEITSMYLGGCATVTSFYQFTDSNLPVLSLTTDQRKHIPDEPKISGNLQVFWHSDGSRNYTTDVPAYSGRIGIERRGASSADFPQKSYSLELRDAKGEDTDVSLLGMPAESDWVLHAPWCDKTMMNNALSMSLAREMGRYAPRTRHVELIINGDYKGVYVLMEKIKRGPDRLDISSLKATDLTGDALTGGYILKIDKTIGGDVIQWYSPFRPCWKTGTDRISFQIDYPDPVSDLKPAQKTYIKDYVTRFEETLYGDDFQDSLLGFRPFADPATFADYSIMQELSHNVDGYRLSTYLYKPKDSKGGKLSAGPLWDLNLSFSNADYINGWYYNDFLWDQPNIICPNGPFQHPDYWRRMNQDTTYWRQYRCRYKNLRTNVLSTANFDHKVDSMAALLDEAQARHYQRWPILGYYVWPNKYTPYSYAATLDTLRSWTHKRFAWLDKALAIPECRCTSPQSCAKPPEGITGLRAGVAGEDILVEWSTLAEDNLRFFGIERSTDGATWTTISTVYAAGYSTGPLAYQFTDASVGDGTYYYRLILTDLDGSEMRSQTRRVVLSGSDKVFVYPNPARETVHLRVPARRLDASLIVEVTDLTGKQIMPEQPVSGAEITLPVSDWAAGIYLIRFRSATWQITRKLVVAE